MFSPKKRCSPTREPPLGCVLLNSYWNLHIAHRIYTSPPPISNTSDSYITSWLPSVISVRSTRSSDSDAVELMPSPCIVSFKFKSDISQSDRKHVCDQMLALKSDCVRDGSPFILVRLGHLCILTNALTDGDLMLPVPPRRSSVFTRGSASRHGGSLRRGICK